MLNKLLPALAIPLLIASPAMADGINVPDQVYPTMGGKYVIRGSLVTVNPVKQLRVAAFEVDTSTGEKKEIENAVVRPNLINTRAGEYHKFVASFPTLNITSEKKVALCMWKDHSAAPRSTAGNTLSLSFRYCRVFSVLPKRGLK